MNKESFRKLGIILNENIPTQELLAEDFNGEYYGLTKRQTEKIRALRDIVTEYNRTLPSKVQMLLLYLCLVDLLQFSYNRLFLFTQYTPSYEWNALE